MAVVGSISAFVLALGAVLWFHDTDPALDPDRRLRRRALHHVFVVVGRHQGRARPATTPPVVMIHHRYGMILFIASEVMFFVAWFWAYFDGFFRHRRHRAVFPCGVVRWGRLAAGAASSFSTSCTCRCSTR